MTETRSFSVGHHAIAILAMAVVVAASNYLVQFPVEHFVGSVNLADTLTWGAFTYPVAFLVTDLTNRRFGPAAARKVVVSGFLLAIVVP
ncbi:MAG: VUT family protein, partial [Roseibium sp.]